MPQQKVILKNDVIKKQFQSLLVLPQNAKGNTVESTEQHTVAIFP